MEEGGRCQGWPVRVGEVCNDVTSPPTYGAHATVSGSQLYTTCLTSCVIPYTPPFNTPTHSALYVVMCGTCAAEMNNSYSI